MNKANKVQEAVKTAVLQNSYAGTLNYFKDDFGVVHVWGQLSGGTRTLGTLIASLPEGYRPQFNMPGVALEGNSNEMVLLQLYIDGGLFLMENTLGGFIRINFSFFAI